MELPLYQVDAFAARPFEGNPAAVCPLDAWLPDALLQSIALENHLSETAYLVREGDGWRIRWFTPACEVDLCGHATLASAWVLFHHLEPGLDAATFASRGGELRVARDGDRIALDFPRDEPEPAEAPDGLGAALGAAPLEVRRGRYWLARFDDERTVRALAPDMRALARLGDPVCVTAPGDEVDFVSRFFGPGVGVDEDPVTGSAHCLLAPYWAERLRKDELVGFQASARGGEVRCSVRGSRVGLAGRVVPYLEGRISVPD